MLVTLLSVLFFYYPSLLTTILSLFACYRIDPEVPAVGELYPKYAQVYLVVYLATAKYNFSCLMSM